jgi:O-acetyl-ADP-ribose deacetylase (regulator of RNase III)
MINITRGNLLKSRTEALVNTVNCVGFMGKGIALQFKKAFPENFRAYQQACRSHQVEPGRMFVFATGSALNPKYIINFPTKRHWKGNSRIEDISSGLKALADEIKTHDIRSVAIPPLGCGLGGLDWNVIRPMIEEAFTDLPEVLVKIFEPAGTPEADTMPVGTEKPKLTHARALLIKVMDLYAKLHYRLSLLEIQKLAYFLQESGEPLRLSYGPGPYGPYAPNLNKVLEILEGHYTRGYGDNQRPDVEIRLLPGASSEAMEFIRISKESLERLAKVSKLIEGFETPYGMELLSTVHWVAMHSSPAAKDCDAAIQAIHQWSKRKLKMFKSNHIEIAWNHLVENGWVYCS